MAGVRDAAKAFRAAEALGPRRADSRRTLETIVDGAIGVLGADRGAPMERIADAVGVHRATLYRYFPTREVLIEALAERCVRDARDLVSAVAALPSARVAVERLAQDTMTFGDRYTFLIGSEPIASAGPDPVGLTELFTRWQRDGVLRADVGAAWLATAFIALGAALFSDPARTHEQRVALLVDTFLNGGGR